MRLFSVKNQDARVFLKTSKMRSFFQRIPALERDFQNGISVVWEQGIRGEPEPGPHQDQSLSHCPNPRFDPGPK